MNIVLYVSVVSDDLYQKSCNYILLVYINCIRIKTVFLCGVRTYNICVYIIIYHMYICELPCVYV